jgi:co-chaperonin GroES (HSP10)
MVNGEKYNGSGFNPVEFNCIVLVDEVPEKTAGGIIRVERDREQYASTKATLVAVSPLAFTYEIWPEGVEKPKPGDIVLIAKYGGTSMKQPNEQGPDYRVIKDKDILAVKSPD